MSAPTFPTPTWTGTANVTTFRRDYIRDLVDTTTTPATYLSSYNRAVKSQFFTDASIDALKTRVETDYAEELATVYTQKYNERVDLGDDTVTADVRANEVLLDATMRLVRALCREAMITDPGFVGSIADATQRAELFKYWATEINRDRTFARSRAGSFASIPLERF